MIPPVRIAHRGASGSGLAPENTLAAFEHAIRLGVDALEIDVRATLDQQIVVLHDATLDRTTDRSGQVARLSLAEVRSADAGGWCGPAFAGQRVPTLAEVLELARHRALVLVEVKADQIAERVLQVIADLRAEDGVVLQSFSTETVRRLRLLAPGLPAAWLVGRQAPGPARLRARRLVRQALELGAHALSLAHGGLTPPFLEEVRQRAMTVWAWTVDDEVTMREMVSLGVQGLITNHPDRLNRVLEDLEAHGGLLPPLGRPRRLLAARWVRRRRLLRLQRLSGA